MPPHPLTNFGIQKYYQVKPKFKPKFKVVYSRNNLPNTINNWAYLVNLYEYKSIGTHWIALYANGNSVAYVEALVLNIPEEIKRFIGKKNIIINIFKIQAYDSIVCTGFINCMFIDFIIL